MPTKPANEYTDDEIRETDPYIKLRERTTYTFEGETCYLSDFDKDDDGEETGLIPLTRAVIGDCWAALQEASQGA